MTFPLWFLWAVIGHLANGVAFIIDKTLLRTAFSRPATYAGMIGGTGIFALVLIPFGVQLPDAMGWFWTAVSGITFVCALWLFFAALATGEASRVVPVVGSLIPMLTWAGTAVFLGERLSTPEAIGFVILIIATAILSGGAAESRLHLRTIQFAVLSAILFAVSSVAGKWAYDGYGFITAFTLCRLWGVAAAVGILLLDPPALRALLEMTGLRRSKGRSSAKKISSSAFVLVLIGQTLGSLGFVAVQYATAIGSAALVNALQAVQYALLVVVALLLQKRAPDLLGEDLHTATIVRKLLAIVLVGAGLWLIV